MKRNSKFTILIVLIIAAGFVWVPKGKKTKDVSPNISSAALDQTMLLTKAVSGKRIEFLDWPRNPFEKLRTKKEINSLFDLKLVAVIWGDKDISAVINNSILSVGDKITDKTVKRIDKNTVVLTDGTNDYVLELH